MGCRVIGLEDEAILIAISRVWAVVANDIDEWRKLFRRDAEDDPGIYILSDDRIDEWFYALTGPLVKGAGTAPSNKYVAFGLAELRSPAMTSHPGIFTRCSGSRLSFPTGMSGGGDDEEDGYASGDTTVEVIALANSKQVAAALITFVLSAIFTSLKPYMEGFGGGHAPVPQDIGEIAPMRDLLPERGGAFWWRMKIKVTSETRLVFFANTELAALPISIHHDSVNDDGAGNAGRVAVGET